MSETHTAYGDRDAPDLHLTSDGSGFITATMIGEEDMAYTIMDLSAALSLGEWLIAHAIAGGARPALADPAPEETRL